MNKIKRVWSTATKFVSVYNSKRFDLDLVVIYNYITHKSGLGLNENKQRKQEMRRPARAQESTLPFLSLTSVVFVTTYFIRQCKVITFTHTH